MKKFVWCQEVPQKGGSYSSPRFHCIAYRYFGYVLDDYNWDMGFRLVRKV